VVEFNHDVFILMVIRLLVGWDAFPKVIGRHLYMPFLSSLHFRMHQNRVQVFYNSKRLWLPSCNPCTVHAFTDLLTKLP